MGTNLQFREYYNALFRNLRLHQNGARTSQAIGISSAEGCAKSSVLATNLAICIANSSEGDVLFINADPANRVPEATFALSKDYGIYDAIHAGVPIDDAISQTKFGKLFAIGCGKQGNDALSASCLVRFRSVLETLKPKYSIIVVDLPMANELTPCFDMAAQLDGVVLTVESKRVSRKTARDTLDHLRFVNAQVLGCVFVDS